MNNKTFKYKNYKNCSFYVGNYIKNTQSMAIQIIDGEGELVTTCTVNMPDYLYYPDSATIKNYSENAGMTKFLEKLGIIEEIFSEVKCNPYAAKSETIDFCLINMDKLKEYSSKFNYNYTL